MNMELNRQDILYWAKTQWHNYAEMVLTNPNRLLKFLVSSDQEYKVVMDGIPLYHGRNLDEAVGTFNKEVKYRKSSVYDLSFKKHTIFSVKIRAENYEAAEQELKDWLTGESIEIPYVSSEVEDEYYTVSGEVIVF